MPPGRSTLPKEQARRRYVELAGLVVLEQIREDSERLDREALPVGPFARLDANKVAAREGKTRGAISNLFGSQAALQAETMAPRTRRGAARSRRSRTRTRPTTPIRTPGSTPSSPSSPPAVRATTPSRRSTTPRCGRCGSRPSRTGCGASASPARAWTSTANGSPSSRRCSGARSTTSGCGSARARRSTTSPAASVSLVEGAWLNQCLTPRHPSDPSAPIAETLRRSGRLLWRGAVEPGP